MTCLDETGPEGAKRVPGPRRVRPGPAGERRPRAQQEIDYGRRGAGYVFGASRPATGEALTQSYARRTTASFVDFPGRAEAWLGPAVARFDAALDNLSAHRAPDVLLRALARPRWGFVFRPTAAADPNLIEPRRKVLRSPAPKGRRFGSWADAGAAVAAATAYGNRHRHPFVRGRRNRRGAARPAGVARTPLAAETCRTDH